MSMTNGLFELHGQQVLLWVDEDQNKIRSPHCTLNLTETQYVAWEMKDEDWQTYTDIHRYKQTYIDTHRYT